MADLPSAYPLRDLWDAAVRGRTVKLTCPRCRTWNSFPAVAMWWLFERNGWKDYFSDVRKRCVCQLCLRRDGEKVRNPKLELVMEEARDDSLPMPSEIDWKREMRRRR